MLFINFKLYNAVLAFCFISKKYLNILNGVKQLLKLNSNKNVMLKTA